MARIASLRAILEVISLVIFVGRGFSRDIQNQRNKGFSP